MDRCCPGGGGVYRVLIVVDGEYGSCLRFIFRNFQTVCMDRISSQAEEEGASPDSFSRVLLYTTACVYMACVFVTTAALIDSIPTSLVHRIIVNLVNDAKQVREFYSRF